MQVDLKRAEYRCAAALSLLRIVLHGHTLTPAERDVARELMRQHRTRAQVLPGIVGAHKFMLGRGPMADDEMEGVGT